MIGVLLFLISTAGWLVMMFTGMIISSILLLIVAAVMAGLGFYIYQRTEQPQGMALAAFLICLTLAGASWVYDYWNANYAWFAPELVMRFFLLLETLIVALAMGAYRQNRQHNGAGQVSRGNKTDKTPLKNLFKKKEKKDPNDVVIVLGKSVDDDR